MQVICPQCGEVGYLQQVNPRYYRIRHYIGKEDAMSKFRYCRVTTDYAEKEIAIQTILNSII